MAQETMKKHQLRPLGNRVLAKRLEQTAPLKGGIILPDNAKQKQEAALVIAVGTGTINKEGKTLPMPVKVGDKILMDKYAGQEVTLNDEEYIIIRAEDVIAIINE